MPPPPSCAEPDAVPPRSACWSFRRWAAGGTSAPTMSWRTPAPATRPSTRRTVYRTLEALVAAGIARRTDLGADRLYYEVAREHRHHHAVCQSCGAVAHLHDASLGPLAEALRAETGFELTPDREVAIPGLCPACQEAR